MLPKRVCSLKNFQFAPKRISFLKNFLYIFVYINRLFTPFRAYRRKRMSMNDLAIAGNFFLFKETLERFQVVYGPFWIELFLACHRTSGIFLLELEYKSRFWWVPSLVMSRMI